MKRIVRLTESDLSRIVKRVIREQEELSDMTQAIEELNKELVNKSVNLYSKPNQRQNDFMRNANITKVENPGGMKPKIKLTLDGTSTLTFRCETNELLLHEREVVYNKMLIDTLKNSGFCQTMRDRKGNMKIVPNADFASTGGDMGGMA
jgi:hypothetical protein